MKLYTPMICPFETDASKQLLLQLIEDLYDDLDESDQLEMLLTNHHAP